MTNQLMPANQNAMLAEMQQKAGLPAHVNTGAVAIEQERAIAEARGQMQLAKMFPRNLQGALAEIIEICKLPEMAGIAFYTVPQGGQNVTGPSIKLIEQIASSLGNFEWGHRELSKIEGGVGPNEFGRSEIEVFAWDKERNNRSIRQITVLHVLDTKQGPRKLRDQRDIDNRIANVASKQMRGRLQALMPKFIIEAAVQECKKTLLGNNEKPISARVRDMVQAFAKYGVTVQMLEEHLGHSLDAVLADELVDLIGVYNSLREGMPASELFGQKGEEAATESAAPAEAQAQNAIAQAAAAGAQRRRTTQQTKVNQAQQTAQTQVNTTQDPAPAVVDTATQVSNADQNQSNSVKAEAQASQAEAAPEQLAPEQAAPVAEAADDGDVF